MSLSVYVHIPFCSKRCDYCDFATWTDKSALIEKYIDTVINQWQYHAESLQINAPLTSIFFGGGTPNLIDADLLAKIVNAIGDKCTITDDTEITVESNPDHVSIEKMKVYVGVGVNRISMGIQSTDQEVLNFLGREHNPEQVKVARGIIDDAGIKNVSCDLIYGSGVESLASWEKTLQETIDMDLQHISAYALGIEQGTPLYQSVAAGLKQTVDEDDLADKYEMADRVLSEGNFRWYEISNWSKPGKESKHNLVYWRGGDVIALGCAAHGYTSGNRWSTPRSIDFYIERFNPSNQSPKINESMFLDRNDNLNISKKQEEFALKLRTRQGVPWPGKSIKTILSEYFDAEFIEFDELNKSIRLTVKGRLVANRLAVDLFDQYEQMLDVVE